MAGVELLTTFSFHVELDGIDVGSFKEATGVESETEVIEFKETGKHGKIVIRKHPGAMKWSDITLKKAVDKKKDLWEWRAKVEKGDIDKARKNGSIVLYDSKSKEIARWNFFSGWPSKWKGADLNAGENSVALEEITITHEGLERA
jgi:phage tail-like protein